MFATLWYFQQFYMFQLSSTSPDFSNRLFMHYYPQHTHHKKDCFYLGDIKLGFPFATLRYLLEMSLSCNFPAQAELSYEGSELRGAELGHFNFRAETELTIPTICMSKNHKFLLLLKNYNQISQF